MIVSRLLPALLLLTAVMSCAGHRSAPARTHDDADVELRADLFKPEAGSLRFSLTRPAYVAVFEVVPFRGVRMLSPATKSGGGWHHAGLNVERVAPALLRVNQFWAGDPTLADRGRPHYFFLVASVHPLQTSPFVGASRAIYEAMGVDNYQGRDPHVAMQSIVTDVLHLPDDSSWVSDSYQTDENAF